jgi:hypothetical protein
VDAARDPMASLARGVADGAAAAQKALARMLAHPVSPGLGTFRADGTVEPSAPVAFLQSSLVWYTAALAVVAVLVAAGRLAWQRRGQALVDLLRGLGTLVLVSSAGLAAVVLLVGAADGLAGWILSRATGNLGARFAGLLAPPVGPHVPVVLMTFLDGVVMIAAVLQLGLLLARGAVLVLLAGLLPLSGSAAGTVTGRAVFTRTLVWLAAFVLYQPLAAAIYAVGFAVAPDPRASPVLATTAGAATIVLALVALPALFRVLRPAVHAVSWTGRGPELGRSLPTGARVLVPAVSPAGPAVRPTGSGAGLARPAVPAPTRMAAVRPVARTARPRELTAGAHPAAPATVTTAGRAGQPPPLHRGEPEEPPI